MLTLFDKAKKADIDLEFSRLTIGPKISVKAIKS